MLQSDFDRLFLIHRRMHIVSKKWLLTGLLAGSAVASAIAVALPLIRTQAATPQDASSDLLGAAAVGSEYCATNAPEARVGPGDPIDRQYSVDVPLETPPIGMPSATVHSIAKGDVVQFEVASPRPGQVAVHGLRDAEAVQVGGVMKVAFRAIYTGRFPLHFHGADGSHFEIVALEVLPKSMVLARSGEQ